MESGGGVRRREKSRCWENSDFLYVDRRWNRLSESGAGGDDSGQTGRSNRQTAVPAEFGSHPLPIKNLGLNDSNH